MSEEKSREREQERSFLSRRQKKKNKKTHEAPDEEGGIEPRRTVEPVEACEGISMALAAAAKVVARAERER